MAKATLEQVTEFFEQIKHERITGERLQELLTESQKSPAEKLINSLLKRARTIIYKMDENNIMRNELMEELAHAYANNGNTHLGEKVAVQLKGRHRQLAYTRMIEAQYAKGDIQGARTLFGISDGWIYPEVKMRILAATAAAGKNQDDLTACKDFYQAHRSESYIPYLIKACVACGDLMYCEIEIAKIPLKTFLRDLLSLVYIQNLVNVDHVDTAAHYANNIFNVHLRIEAYIAIAAVTKSLADFRKIYSDIERYIRVELHDIRAKMYALLAKASRDKAYIGKSIDEMVQIPFDLQEKYLGDIAEACVWVDDIVHACSLTRQINDKGLRARAHLAIAKALMEQSNN